VRRELEAIYRANRQGLFTLALSITRCPQQAEDAVQEAFARMWRLPGPVRGDPTAYAFAAVRNAAIDQKRRRPAAELTEPVSIFNGRADDPAWAAADAEQRRLVRQAVEALPAEQREAVVLRVYAGLTFEQMAETLGEPLPTVASRYRRGLDRLKDAIDGKL
jgi:RNA polymerase sigma-70 factor (ECF subfamily)